MVFSVWQCKNDQLLYFNLFPFITAKPTRSWIEHEGDKLTSGQQLSLTEGDLLKLACSVLGGKPAPVITWRAIDGRGRATNLIENQKQSNKKSDLGFSFSSSSNNDVTAAEDGTATTTVVLSKRLTRDDLASTIECHVEHEAVKAGALDSRVSVDVNGKRE